MHLKSIAMKGFKSFPGRTRLEFGPGVSVVVGPNGSGKSNITDAVLWALGEQSPLAVRGQSMQDVIFAGGHGVQARSEAEVELVLDNSGGALPMPASEISIVRRLNRAGEGEYRLNGARCRLIDVIEVLSDTGLGKEMHSVISQGRVEAIVTSKPRDRRLLIEEAAGLGKHRKRRRRAQLKLERTQENLDRALDVEREARSRLRPLKRQAEAAELHERIERQSLEARWELSREQVRARGEQLAAAERDAAAARAARDEVDAALQEVAQRRERAEQALAARSERHDAIARLAFGARAARERTALRLERVGALATELDQRGARRRQELATLEADAGNDEDGGATDRVAALEQQLERLDRERGAALEAELAGLAEGRDAAAAAVVKLERVVSVRSDERDRAEQALEAAREAWREAQRAVEAARRESARVGAELAATNQFLRSHAATGDGLTLDARLEVRSGYELALAAALGGRLGAAVVDDLGAGSALLDRAGSDGGRALVASERTAGADGAAGSVAGADGAAGADAPVPGAERLLDLVSAPDEILPLVSRLLGGAWVVEDLAGLPDGFDGIAVTRSGRVWFGAWGELRQVPGGGRERALEQRNRREQLVGDAEIAAQAEQDALAAGRAAEQAVRDAEDALDAADASLRDSDRERAEAGERQRRAAWLIEQRRSAPEQGESAVRRAQLEGELAAERRLGERAVAERERRLRRIETLRAQEASDTALAPQAERLAAALEALGEALAARVASLDGQLAADQAAGESVAGELRACAAQEAQLQTDLRAQGEAVTGAEVRAQQARDQVAEAHGELESVASRLGLEADAPAEPMDEEQQQSLRERIERLARRREQLGPVNPLAADEYREALEHVEELEAQRTDLETALRELKALIRDTDRQITESFEQTFAAASRNFEELVEDVFPGGRGRLRLVREDSGPRPVLGGGTVDGEEGSDADAAEASEAAADAEAAAAEELRELGLGPDDMLGVEIEITPAGKSMKRLSLLSGGEKSMTAIAFLFAVFLARPCPFYILDEVEAALDDLNIDRFLMLLRRYSKRAQFVVVTHQKRTMEAADWLYGVSMGGDGTSKVVSRRLPSDTRIGGPEADPAEAAEADAA